jgi:hypothetical protein
MSEKRTPLFNMTWPRSLNWHQQVDWLFLKLMFWGWLAVTVGVTIIVIPKFFCWPCSTHDIVAQMVGFICIVATFSVSRYFAVTAERSTYPPKPRPPVLDEI